jgi:hypothetical protein
MFWAHDSSSTTPLFVEVYVPIQGSERWCAWGISILSTIFLLDFGPVPTLFAVPNLDIYTCHINNNRDRCHMYNVLVLWKRNDNLWHSEINVREYRRDNQLRTCEERLHWQFYLVQIWLLFAHSVVQHILLFFVLYNLCCQFLWINIYWI